MDQAEVVSNILETFCYFSGQKVNVSKSQVYFSPSTHLAWADQIVSQLGFSKVENLGLYLGLPLLHAKSVRTPLISL